MAEGAQERSSSAGDAAGGSSVPARGRRWLRVLSAVLLAILALLALAPQWIAWSPLRHELPRLRLRGFQEKIHVGAASLTWWGPIELYDIELYAPDGKPFIHIPRAYEPRGVWRVIFNRRERILTYVERPAVEVLLRPDGSNIDDAMAPVLRNPRLPRRERTIEVTGGSLHALDTATGRSAQWKNLALKATTNPDSSTQNHLKLSAELAGADGAPPLRLESSWTGGLHRDKPTVTSWEVALDTENLPLAAFAPLFSRVSPDLELEGTITSHLTLAADAEDHGAARWPSRGDWLLTARDLKIICPGRLGEDEPVLEQSELRGKFSRDGRRCRIEDFAVVTDFGRLAGGGDIPLGDDSAQRSDSDGGGRDIQGFQLQGEVDLVALARLLPNSLPMREDAHLTEGRVQLGMSSRREENGLVWSGRMETAKLAGRVGDEELSWDKPLNVSFEGHQTDGRFRLDRLDAVSEFLNASVRGDGDKTKFEAGCDLDLLSARLSEFFDSTSRELRGKLRLAGEVSRKAPRQFEIAARTEAEDLLIRRQVTKLVERRVGDIDRADLEPDEGRASSPPDTDDLEGRPTVAPDRRTRRLQRRAERAEKAQARRREREERKRADEIVRVPVTEWKTVWNEPKFTLETQCGYDAENRSLEIARFEASSDGLSLHARGRIDDVLAERVLDLEGEAAYDLERLLDRVRETVGSHVQISGNETRSFRFHGPLRGVRGEGDARPIVPLGLTGRAEIGWQRGALFGLEAPAGGMALALDHGIIDVGPLDLPVSGGRVALAPRLLFDRRPAVIVLPAGRVADNIELTDEICDSWLKFIAPALAEATRTSGRFSLDLGETRFPLADPSPEKLNGRLEIPRGQVLPGPLMIEIGGLAARIIAAVDGRPPRALIDAERPLLEINDQRVDFELRDRRVYHSGLEFTMRGIIVRTRGSVGLDQSLDLVAELSPSDALASRARFLEALQGRPLELPISGTLKHPRVDGRAIGRLAAQLGQDAVESIINRGIRNLMDRRRDPDSPP